MSEPAPSDSSTRLADVLDEYFKAVAAGTPPSRDELLAAHPDVKDDLAAALFGLDFMRGAAPSLSGGLTGNAEAPSTVPGGTLGDYRLIREVGRGGMAVVYEAEQISLGRRVALKVLPFAAVLDARQLQRFKNEALAVAHLHHPHIVPVYAVGSERGVHYFAMQLIEGQSLAQAIRELEGGGAGEGAKSPVSSHGSTQTPGYVRMAATLGVQAAEALDHAHQLGIVHRDVKPGNLLVDQAGKLWVTDFGLATSRHDTGLTMTGELLGTVRYMSPEQALGKRVPIDHRTDIYSLGATLYELFTLVPAVPGDDPHHVMRDIAEKELVPPRQRNPALPVDLETVLLKAMAKDPAGRYATAQEMADDLKRYLADRPILARRPSLLERAARWARRHRAGVAAALVVMFVGAAALVIGAKREEANTRQALQKAEENLDLAFRAVQSFMTHASGETLGNEPTLTPVLRMQLEGALEFYDRYLSERHDAIGHTDRSSALSLLGRFEEGLVAADRAIAIDPTLGRAHFARGVALRRLQRPEEALHAYDRSIELDPSGATTFLERGVALKELGRHEEALKDYERVIELKPDRPHAHNNRGQHFLALERYAEALEGFDRAIKAEPRFFLGHHNRSVALVHLGRIPESLEAIDRAIALGPDDPQAHLHRGAVLDRLKRWDEALAASERAIALDPTLGRPHFNRAVILMSLERKEEALDAVARSIELEPTYAPGHLNLGVWLRAAGRPTEALEAADRIIALHPRLVPPRLSRATTLHGLGRVEETVQEFEKVLEIEPDAVPLLKQVAWYRALAPEPASRNPKRAVELAQRAVKLAPTDGMLWITLSAALCRAEAWPETLEALEKAMALRQGGDAYDWFFASIAHAHLGRKEVARTWYDKAVAWAETNAKDNAELAELRAVAAKALE